MSENSPTEATSEATLLAESPSEATTADTSEATSQLMQTTSQRAGFVAIVGKPNVGKSTLLNTLLGIKVAPITPKPQTTRKGVRGIYSFEGEQLIFVDTPGLHKAHDALGSFMNREVWAATVDVEAVLWVVDLRRPPGDEDKDVARMLSNLPDTTPIFLIGNKLDAAKYPDEAISLYHELLPHAQARMMSAQEDPDAVYALRQDLLELLPESPFYFPADISSDQSREDWAAEIIRESAMIHLRQELPYTVAVKVNEWRDPDDERSPVYIQADVWIERSNHRGMVLGKGGAMIKTIGRRARKQLELFLSHQVFVDLEVVVQRNWRDDQEALRELGYQG